MERVVQQDGTGCGLACIAMLAARNYSDVKSSAIEILEMDVNGKFYTTAPNLRKLGKAFKLDIDERCRKFQSFSLLPSLAILAINYREDQGTWHWVVFCRTDDEEFILDPKQTIKSERRFDFDRLSKKTKWFISVKRAS